MQNTRQGHCHCGGVRFEVSLPDGLKQLIRCNCSLCSRKSAAMMAVPLAAFKIISGADHLTVYQWNTRVAKHYFCSICGIYTHHQRRTAPAQYGINVACLEGVDVTALVDVSWADGAALSGGVDQD